MMEQELRGVVDTRVTRFKVYGVEGLKVAIASFFLTTRCNTLATVYAVAERTADVYLLS